MDPALERLSEMGRHDAHTKITFDKLGCPSPEESAPMTMNLRMPIEEALEAQPCFSQVSLSDLHLQPEQLQAEFHKSDKSATSSLQKALMIEQLVLRDSAGDIYLLWGHYGQIVLRLLHSFLKKA